MKYEYIKESVNDFMKSNIICKLKTNRKKINIYE